MVRKIPPPRGERDQFIAIPFKVDPATKQMLDDIGGSAGKRSATLRRLIRDEHARMMARLKAGRS